MQLSLSHSTQLSPEERLIITKWHNEFFVQQWNANSLAKSNWHVVLFKNPQISGYLIYMHILNEVEIIEIFTNQNKRKQGIASSMLHKLFDICQKLNVVKIFLEVRNNNDSAIKLYAKHGFEQYSIRKNYYSNPNGQKLDALLLAKLL